MKHQFDIIMYTNSRGIGTSSISDEYRFPLIYTFANQMRQIGKVVVITNIIPFVLFPLKYLRLSIRKDLKMKCMQYEENLFVYSFPSLLPLSLIDRNFPLSAISLNKIRHMLKIALNGLGISHSRKKVAWFAHPLHLNYLNMAGENLSIYECHDDHSLLGIKNRDISVLVKEEKLARSVNLIFATSQSLTERLLGFNSNTYYFPNACDYEMFHKAQNPNTPIPEKLKPFPRPIIGFMGNLFKWYNYDLLEKVISLKKEWSFVFIGEIHSNARKFCQNLWKYPNAQHLGWQDFNKLPSFLKGFDVAIMPYTVDELTHTVNPDKMWQYMAAGVPIVATPTREIMRFKDIIEIGNDVPSFILAIEKALKKKDDHRFIKEMTQIAQNESLKARTKFVFDLIDKNLDENL